MSYLIALYDFLKVNYVWFTLLSVIIAIAVNSLIRFEHNVSGYVMAVMILIGVILTYYPIYLFVVSVLLVYINTRGLK